MCVTVCNIGHDQNQQFICNERKAAQLASVFQTSNITTNNRFCNQINTSIMHNIRVDITNDPGPRHRQQTVISANAVFCHRIFLLLISIQSLQLLADLVWTSSVMTCDDNVTNIHRAWQESGCTMTTPHPSVPPPIGQSALTVAADWSAGTHAACWTLFTLRWFVTDPDIDWRNFNSIIDTETLDLVTGQWPLHELFLAAETKRWHIPQHEDTQDTHNLWHKHAAIMLTRLSFIILPCSDTSRF